MPKLEAVGIRASSFVVGAFGSDDADRDKLPAIAVERAERSFGTHILPQEVAIVGDTRGTSGVHDISARCRLPLPRVTIPANSWKQ